MREWGEGMNLYLYRLGESTPLLEIEDVKDYTADTVTRKSGETYGPLAGGLQAVLRTGMH